MGINITTPNYYHREYTNDIGKSPDDPSIANQCKRVALVALPFVSLYKPAGFALSLGMGSLRVLSNLTTITDSSMADLPQNLLQLTISSASIGGTLLAHPLGMLVSTVQDVTTDTLAMTQSLYNGEYTGACQNGAHLLNNSLYLGMFFGGGLQLSIASLGVQVLLGLYHSRDEFRKGRWLEGSGHFAMATIRLGQLHEQTRLLQAHWKLYATDNFSLEDPNKQEQQVSESPDNASVQSYIQRKCLNKTMGTTLPDPDSETLQIAQVITKYAPQNQKHPVYGKTIYYAAIGGDEQAVRLCIKHQMDQDTDKTLTLKFAIRSKSLPLVKYLTEEMNYCSGKELYDASFWDAFDVFDYFISKGHKLPSDIIIKSIHGVGLNGVGSDMRRINFLILRGADSTCIANAPEILNQSMSANNMDLMIFALQNKAYEKMDDLEDWREHPLHRALSGELLFCNIEIKQRLKYAQLIADHVAQIGCKFSDRIWGDFIKLPNRDILQTDISPLTNTLLNSLLSKGLSIDTFPGGPGEALRYAIRTCNNPAIVENMLKKGADPNYRQSKTATTGETILESAIKIGNNAVISLLIKYGAKLNSI